MYLSISVVSKKIHYDYYTVTVQCRGLYKTIIRNSHKRTRNGHNGKRRGRVIVTNIKGKIIYKKNYIASKKEELFQI